jgi:hypothetical protein
VKFSVLVYLSSHVQWIPSYLTIITLKHD